jgi:signal peptidase I
MVDQTQVGRAPGEAPPTRPRSGGSHARPEPGRRARRSASRRPGSGSFWRELPVLLLIAFAIAFLVKTFLVQAFYIPSGSMQNTLGIGDRVLVNKLGYRLADIHRGDVVVFDGVDSFTPEVQIPEPTDIVGQAAQWLGRTVGLAPPDERDFVKRVIGVAGDHVKCCDASGRVTVNGVPLDETSYLFPGNTPSQTPFDVIVPEGKLWVMGDHRAASSDSRAHLGDPGGGFVPVDHVIGRAFAVVWPWRHLEVLSVPSTFDNPALQKAGQ